MSQPIVDLRSDTVTRPTAAMRQAMATAEVGDDVFGDDPTVNALESRMAQLTGKEAALFVASGTMGNQLAVNVLTRPSDEVLLEAESHVYYYEQGGMAANSGCLANPVHGERGVLPMDALVRALRSADDHVARVTLVCTENTHNRAGGAIVPLSRLQELASVARARSLKVHLDGARLWNAHVATGVSLAEWCATADSIMMCFSKGLGAPVGSILVGSADHVKAARRVRKRWGGGMRQAGILAAACLHALDHHIARLADDHARARRLAEGFAQAPGVSVPKPDTNIVIADLEPGAPDAATVVAALAERGVRTVPFGPRRVRAIAHLDVDDAGVEQAIGAFREVLTQAVGAAR
ncbi:MAG: aminotransferase class I/II-fold pyridoxal phosphate-dependent enzyme [Candidatus Eisenbacteria bacterium]|nr:aminotransferase class I/II-fold pyridoxal phosphate-dependent enzyme [Candidatus Eisenbacteria bacterium]